MKEMDTGCSKYHVCIKPFMHVTVSLYDEFRGVRYFFYQFVIRNTGQNRDMIFLGGSILYLGRYDIYVKRHLFPYTLKIFT